MSFEASHGLFSLLPEKRAQWKEFAFSLGSQGVALVFIAWLGILHPEILTSPYHNQHLTPLVSTPVAVNHDPAPVKEFKLPKIARPELPSPTALRVPADIPPKTQAVPFTPPPQVELATTKTMELPAAKPVI